ncbi:MAG TPA: hypothetical protein VD863_27370 [Bradyrhizobium sp.]|nr:hypothetical protein [Bradyrhizobium sp.]
MRTSIKALVVLGFGAALMLPAAPAVQAADLEVTSPRKAMRAVKRVRLVRDYDGTPVVVRVAPPWLQRDGGQVLLEHTPAPRAVPRHYLNGQPVLPTNAVLRHYRS